MSEAEYEWPLHGNNGWLDVTHSDGEVHRLWWNGSKWSEGPFAPWQLFTAQLIERGYLGVRREKPENTPDDGNAMVAQQALDEWRNVKQAPKAADWAYKWAVDLCERLGAR